MQLEIMAQCLQMHGRSIERFDNESLDGSTVFESRKKTLDRKGKHQSKDVGDGEDEDVNTDNRSTEGEKRKSNRKSKKTKIRSPEEPYEPSDSLTLGHADCRKGKHMDKKTEKKKKTNTDDGASTDSKGLEHSQSTEARRKKKRHMQYKPRLLK